MKISLPMKPNVWTVCKALQKEESLAHTKYLAAISGEALLDPNPLRTKKRLDKFQKLRGIVTQYNKIPITDYINMMSAHFNDA